MGWKSNINVHFSKKYYFPILFCPLFLGMRKKCTQFLECYCYYIPHIFNFYQDYIWMLQFTDRFSSWNRQVCWKKKIWSKCYLTILNFHKKLVWLPSFWIEYSNNDQLFFFPESKFNVYLCILRWHHNRFQTLGRCYRDIFNFPTLKIWEIDPLGTFYIHPNYLTCSICRIAELEIPIPTFLALALQSTS